LDLCNSRASSFRVPLEVDVSQTQHEIGWIGEIWYEESYAIKVRFNFSNMSEVTGLSAGE
jgi:hypothetical protein